MSRRAFCTLLSVLVGLALFETAAGQVTRVLHFGPCPFVQLGVYPDSENVQFYLFTRENQFGAEIDLRFRSLPPTYNHQHPTKIVIHGWRDAAHDVDSIKNAYVATGFYNVIVVDYSALSPGPAFCYPIVIHNAPHVGRCVAQLVQRLRQAGTRDLHVIGFSLGAHVAGFAAVELRPYLLPRITGLDPAKPFFVTILNDNKLDASDAIFVDIIHTSAGYQGVVEMSGHVDFYVNGGSLQPGCGPVFTAYFQGCNHKRALEYFAESINSTVGFWGWQCAGHYEAVTGQCTPKLPAILMGEHVPYTARGMAQCDTGDKHPYALGPWVLPSQRTRS